MAVTLRVLLVSQRFPPARVAGSELQVKLLARSLARQGVDVEVLTTQQRGEPPPEDIGVPVTAVPVMAPPLRRVSQWALVRRWLRGWDKRFDLVHCHCISPASLASLQAYHALGVPRLLQPSLGGTGGEMERARLPLLGTYIKKIIQGAEGYAVLNEDIRRELDGLGIAADRLKPVRNGIDLGEFHPATSQERQSLRLELNLPTGPLVLFVGQLVERKGLLDLLAVWGALRRSSPDASLVITGEGPLEQAVNKAASTDASIRWLGTRRDVNRLMQAADVLALPSYNESFGCVLLEALACGLPIVAGNTGIAAELPLHGAAGLVIEPGDRGALKSALQALLADSSLRQRCASACPAFALPYDIDTVSADLVKIYESLL